MGVEADYVVLRRHPDLPEQFRLPAGFEGRWLDRSQVPLRRPRPPHGVDLREAVAVPTGRFEVRDYDGAVAEVWEFRP